MNELIREMIVLLRSQATRYSVVMRAELSEDLPQIVGDRVQLQQVLMNLMINGIEATKHVDGRRELAVKSQRAEDEQQLMVSVTDTERANASHHKPNARRTRGTRAAILTWRVLQGAV